eukprot:TRINITY_DN101697_c0_g1_i1.p1 TRINITY_DN101697_c0_g1~~TRINITY_DN101697_c0_g1_i1.p1  ORF type:complete len:237 (-),score=49.91 TRINITY_DN101697_c0_g1_i1:35-745(-)
MGANKALRLLQLWLAILSQHSAATHLAAIKTPPSLRSAVRSDNTSGHAAASAPNATASAPARAANTVVAVHSGSIGAKAGAAIGTGHRVSLAQHGAVTHITHAAGTPSETVLEAENRSTAPVELAGKEAAHSREDEQGKSKAWPTPLQDGLDWTTNMLRSSGREDEKGIEEPASKGKDKAKDASEKRSKRKDTGFFLSLPKIFWALLVAAALLAAYVGLIPFVLTLAKKKTAFLSA